MCVRETDEGERERAMEAGKKKQNRFLSDIDSISYAKTHINNQANITRTIPFILMGLI